MAANNFATMVTVKDGIPFASHLPFVIDRDAGENGTLIAHMARANSQWKDLSADTEVLVIFQGPHAYVSPSLYETHPSVPTWNYLTVHAYARPRIIEDEAAVRAILQDLVSQHEAPGSGWTMASAEGYVARMLRSIVAFELTITRLEGKAKLSQNRDATDAGNVAASLLASEYELERAVGEAMRRLER
jgi:transcriptional regulator